MNKIFWVLIYGLFAYHFSSAQSGLNVNRGTSVLDQGYLTVGDEISLNTAFSSLDIQAKEGSSFNTIYLNPFGGDIYMGTGQSGRMAYYNGEKGWFGLGTLLPETRLQIEGNTDASLSTHGLLILGSTAGTNMVFDNNEIQARNNGNASHLYLNHEGGTLFAKWLFYTGGGKIMKYDADTGEIGYDNSSRRYKINIETLYDDWSKILKVRPVKFARPQSPDYAEYGYIAEEIDSIGLTNLVGYDEEGLPDDVRYDRMVLYIAEILKIRQENIEAQNRMIKSKQKELEAMQKIIKYINQEMKLRKVNSSKPYDSVSKKS